MLADSVKRAEGIFWTGALTKLLIDNNFNAGAYTSVTQKLIAMGCIEQVQRGGGRAPSIWCLITEPTMELYDASSAKSKSGVRLSKRTQKDRAIQALNERVSKLELLVQRLVANENNR